MGKTRWKKSELTRKSGVENTSGGSAGRRKARFFDRKGCGKRPGIRKRPSGIPKAERKTVPALPAGSAPRSLRPPGFSKASGIHSPRSARGFSENPVRPARNCRGTGPVPQTLSTFFLGESERSFPEALAEDGKTENGRIVRNTVSIRVLSSIRPAAFPHPEKFSTDPEAPTASSAILI